MKNTFLSGEIDLGVLGKRSACLFKNEKREGNQPHFRLVIKDGDSWKDCGAFWLKEKKEDKDGGVLDGRK